MRGFDHEKLDVYRVATEALAVGVAATRRVPREDQFLRNQLLRALTSVSFNLAEATGEFSVAEKVRFFRMSRRSATESAAIVDALVILGYVEGIRAADLKDRLSRVCAMLTQLIRKRDPSRRLKSAARTAEQSP
jgi:four helix bundle protein